MTISIFVDFDFIRFDSENVCLFLNFSLIVVYRSPYSLSNKITIHDISKLKNVLTSV